MTTAALAVVLVVVVAAGCAGAPGPSVVAPTGIPPRTSPSATLVPRPSAPPGADVPLPADAARIWSLPSDPGLGIDLRTSGRILVRAGCLGFSGDLTTTRAIGDPAAGAPAGPTVSIAITARPDAPGRARCLGFSAPEQEFVAALKASSRLTVSGDRLYLSGEDAALELAAAS